MKDAIVQEIFSLMEANGLAPINGGKSDITVDRELLDAEVRSSEKKIRYENAVLVDEAEKTVFLYEKTTEKSKSFFLEVSDETSFESDKTLMRPVKGIFMGTNGVATNYDFDLGNIPKSIKLIAEKNGFKFKTVLRRKSAQNH